MEPVSQMPTPEPEAGRQQSTIEFAYTDLDGSIEVVQGIHRAGGTSCEYDQLAAEMKAQPTGGNFRLRVNGAKLFGLVLSERSGRVGLTDLGRQIIDPEHSRQARAMAFLNVPLYKQVYEQFKGSVLPPIPGLERAIEEMGVGSKVKKRARQVMLRSAKQAGFFEHAFNRMVMPSGSRLQANERHDAAAPAPAADRTDDHRRGVHGGGSGGGHQHPLIQGLLLTLPEPGHEWPAQERVNWLTMASSIFKMIYTEQSPSVISITAEGGTTSAT